LTSSAVETADQAPTQSPASTTPRAASRFMDSRSIQPEHSCQHIDPGTYLINALSGPANARNADNRKPTTFKSSYSKRCQFVLPSRQHSFTHPDGRVTSTLLRSGNAACFQAFPQIESAAVKRLQVWHGDCQIPPAMSSHAGVRGGQSAKCGSRPLARNGV
jgi:hypothetical protein